MKIVLVEDDRELMNMVASFLKTCGYPDVDCLRNPLEAISYLEKNRPDIVFLDINLENDLTGFDVLARARSYCPATKFIMCSAYREEYEEESMERGADAFLSKPTHPEKLLERIRYFENK